MWPSPVFRFISGCRKGPPTIYHVVTLHSSHHCMHDPSVQPQDVRCIPDGSRTAPPRKRKKASKVSGRRRTTGVAPVRGGFFSWPLVLNPAPWFTPREADHLPAPGTRAARPVSGSSQIHQRFSQGFESLYELRDCLVTRIDVEKLFLRSRSIPDQVAVHQILMKGPA